MNVYYDLDPAAPRDHSRHYSKNHVPTEQRYKRHVCKTHIILQTYEVNLEAGEHF